MERALELAWEGLGRVWPNPCVGCVIVKDGVIVGQGRTGDGGRPHAEEVALERAGEAARGADVYVSLEPCFHARVNGSCTENLIKAGVGRVVIACHDPDPRTAGQGIAALKQAGIAVDMGVCEADALEVNQGFFLKVQQARPFITLKMATSADEKIAGGSERWITGEEARAHGHVLRSRHDAILVGAGTVEADDPMLTTRGLDLAHQSVRVVMDTHLRIDKGSKLVLSASRDPLWVLYESDKNHRKQELEDLGCKLVLIDDLSVSSAVQKLAELGITRLLVEGGSKVWGSFVEAGLFDALAWYRSPDVIGDGGMAALENSSIETVLEKYNCHEVEEAMIQRDSYKLYKR